jgi:3-oxoacyl-[acyl-carrier protein] reductase
MSKNILITGLSRGVGLAIAEVLLQEGNTVYGIARNETDALQTLKAQYPQTLQFRSVDLAEPAAVKDAVFGGFIDIDTPLHGLVNNAAMAYDDIVTNLDLEPLEAMYRVNVFSPMVLTKYAIRNMILHKIAGSIVHISSISVHTGYKGLAMYASSKGAMEAFSKNTAREWGERKIRSNCVVAGFMETEMSAALTDDQKARIYKRTALKEATSVESVADTVAFLLSDRSASITGQNIHVDAGTV